jgi:RNA polymerase sigma-70 factor, ECF subfamily
MAVVANMSQAESIRKGDISVFEKVFREYYAPLTLFASTLVKDREVAEEIVQEFFYYYWNNRHSIEIQSSLKSYFFQSIRNRALKHIRHENVKQRYVAGVMDNTPAGSHIYELNVYELKELEEKVQVILNRLPATCSRIFSMSRFEGMTYKQIADKLSISVKTVEANMSKALAGFREGLKTYTG